MANGRVDDNLQQMIQIYKELLGSKAWECLVCVVTKVDWDSDQYETAEDYLNVIRATSKSYSDFFNSKYREGSPMIIPISFKPIKNPQNMNPNWMKA